MVKERMDLLELLHKGGMDGDVDFLREALRVLVEGIMDAEVSSRIGAEYGERSPERVTQRNGYRSRAWDTRVGTMELHIPKLREGSYFPSLLDASFSYQWQAGGADISGATGSTYTLADADEGKAISVAVSFTDNAGNAESVASAATAAVEAAPLTPLTASVENVAASHDGENVFTFELRFSEEFGISYKTLRDHAFTVTGGTVKKAQRLEQGSNIGWRITVSPNSSGAVTIILPITEDCDAQGAICTEDGRMLSTELVLTVSGP